MKPTISSALQLIATLAPHERPRLKLDSVTSKTHRTLSSYHRGLLRIFQSRRLCRLTICREYLPPELGSSAKRFWVGARFVLSFRSAEIRSLNGSENTRQRIICQNKHLHGNRICDEEFELSLFQELFLRKRLVAKRDVTQDWAQSVQRFNDAAGCRRSGQLQP
jgi:hypothetical protein